MSDPELRPDWIEIVERQLRESGTVEFTALPDDARPAFSLSGAVGAIRVRNADGGHVGTFATVSAACRAAWAIQQE